MPLAKEKLQELWLLLFKRSEELSDEEIESLLAVEDELGEFIHRVWRSFPEAVKSVKRYRARKKELSERSTEELQTISKNITRDKSQALADDPDDTKLPDSFFEAPPIDSNEHIVYELLKERKAAGVTTTTAG